MDRGALNFAFSPCPNDTFAFHAFVHGLVDGPAVSVHMDDIEALNARAERGEAEVTKISIAAYGRVRDRYALLRAGGAAGYGVGPVIVARSRRPVGGRIAIPGERTTAALLLKLLGDFDTVPMRFDRIQQAVLNREVDCGIVIHEGRFTFEARGLTQLADLGALWEVRMQCPIPLAGIAIRRDLAPRWGAAFDRALHDSVRYAFAHREASHAYVAEHAQEMDPGVAARHIELYVNDYSLALDEVAVATLLSWAEQQGMLPNGRNAPPIFV